MALPSRPFCRLVIHSLTAVIRMVECLTKKAGPAIRSSSRGSKRITNKRFIITSNLTILIRRCCNDYCWYTLVRGVEAGDVDL